MYEILRVPHEESSIKTGYEMMKAYCGPALKISFEDFYKKIKSMYMISTRENFCYTGMGVMSYKTHTDYEQPSPFNRYGNEVYSLDIVLFDEVHIYNQVYELTETMLVDCRDRVVLVENIPNTNTALINALRNLKFKRNRVADKEFTQSWYYIPNGLKMQEEKLVEIKPRYRFQTIDKPARQCGQTAMAEELAKEAYTKDLLKRNIAEANENNSNSCCRPYQQTIGEFMSGNGCCYLLDDSDEEKSRAMNTIAKKMDQAVCKSYHSSPLSHIDDDRGNAMDSWMFMTPNGHY